MKKSTRIEYTIGILACVIIVFYCITIWKEHNDFHGLANLDKNRSRADQWLRKGRAKDEILSKFGRPNNSINDDVWIWFFNLPNSETNTVLSLEKIDFRNDGFWIEFSNRHSSGPLRSISGNFEELQIILSTSSLRQ